MSIKLIMFQDDGADMFGPVIYCDHCGKLLEQGIYVYENNEESSYDFASDVKFYCNNGVCSRCEETKGKPWGMVNDFVHYLMHNHGKSNRHITKVRKVTNLKRYEYPTAYQSSLTFKSDKKQATASFQ